LQHENHLAPIYFDLDCYGFLVSAVFPFGAGFSKDTSLLPGWWAAADATTAFLLAVLVLAVLGSGQSRITKPVEEETYRAYRVLIHGIFALLVIFVFFGSHIVWNHCLSGIAWRSWLLLYALPAGIALCRERA
jgi:ABC-type arginine transport system permease subunit